MGLAPYYDRAAVAISQVVTGFDSERFADEVSDTAVGLSFSSADLAHPQGAACVDLVTRLLARLYPKIVIVSSGSGCQATVDTLKALATSINPRIEFPENAPIGISVGAGEDWPRTVYAGTSAWTGIMSIETQQDVGTEDVPFGAGIAACLAVGAVFRMLYIAGPAPATTHLNAFTPGTEPDLAGSPYYLTGSSALVGAGAVGQAALWALARSPLVGDLYCIDGETFDLGNMQRYVLTAMANLDESKAKFAADFLNDSAASRGPHGIPVGHHWSEAVDLHGATWTNTIIAVDSAFARRQVQATLPQWIANGWTQTGDLGVSEHHFLHGACLSCLYLPVGRSKNEDEIVATALGVPESKDIIRDLLYRGIAAPSDLLELIAERLGIDSDLLGSFAERSVRELYVEGICGGSLMRLRGGAQPMHVPLAHQSALAGVLLAARLTRRASGYVAASSEVCRIDVRRDVPELPHQYAEKDPRGICICQDEDYISVFGAMWG